jgi:hypothetical protein
MAANPAVGVVYHCSVAWPQGALCPLSGKALGLGNLLVGGRFSVGLSRPCPRSPFDQRFAAVLHEAPEPLLGIFSGFSGSRGLTDS